MVHFSTWRNAFFVLIGSVVLGMWGAFSPAYAQFGYGGESAIAFNNDFTATFQEDQRAINLSWSTRSERQTAGFVLQRATDIQDFVELDPSELRSFIHVSDEEQSLVNLVEGEGGTVTGYDYLVTDQEAMLEDGETYYYRLIEVEQTQNYYVLGVATAVFGEPTAVAYNEDLEIVLGEERLELTWSTSTEENTSGFVFLRETDPNDFIEPNSSTMSSFIPLFEPGSSSSNPLISAQGDVTLGYQYTAFDEDASLDNGTTYYYRLVEVEGSNSFVILDTKSITIGETNEETEEEETATSTPTDTPTATPTNTPTSTPTRAAESTSTNTPTPIPTDTPTPTPTDSSVNEESVSEEEEEETEETDAPPPVADEAEEDEEEEAATNTPTATSTPEEEEESEEAEATNAPTSTPTAASVVATSTPILTPTPSLTPRSEATEEPDATATTETEETETEETETEETETEATSTPQPPSTATAVPEDSEEDESDALPSPPEPAQTEEEVVDEPESDEEPVLPADEVAEEEAADAPPPPVAVDEEPIDGDVEDEAPIVEDEPEIEPQPTNIVEVRPGNSAEVESDDEVEADDEDAPIAEESVAESDSEDPTVEPPPPPVPVPAPVNEPEEETEDEELVISQETEQAQILADLAGTAAAEAAGSDDSIDSIQPTATSTPIVITNPPDEPESDTETEAEPPAPIPAPAGGNTAENSTEVIITADETTTQTTTGDVTGSVPRFRLVGENVTATPTSTPTQQEIAVFRNGAQSQSTDYAELLPLPDSPDGNRGGRDRSGWLWFGLITSALIFTLGLAGLILYLWPNEHRTNNPAIAPSRATQTPRPLAEQPEPAGEIGEMNETVSFTRPGSAPQPEPAFTRPTAPAEPVRQAETVTFKPINPMRASILDIPDEVVEAAESLTNRTKA